MQLLNFQHKKTFLLFLCLSFSLFLISCGSKKVKTPVQTENKSGDYVARIHFKDYGYIDLNLYEKASKTAMEEFIRLAKEGYYNGNTIKSVIDDYAILISAEAGSDDSLSVSETVSENESKDFKNEINRDYYPFRGSLCITDNGNGISADQFIIVTADTDFLAELKKLLEYKKITPQEYYLAAYGTELDEDTLALFDTYGGAPWLYGHCIVFGQVYYGFDVLEQISVTDIEEGSSYKPLNDIIIESIEIK